MTKRTPHDPSQPTRSVAQVAKLTGAASLIAMISATASFADEVTLRAKDGSADITANLMDFDGNRYRLQTQIGEIQIDALQVDCIAGACPTVASGEGAEFEVAGNTYVVNSLLPALLDDFAAGVSGTASMVAGNGGNSVSLSSAGGDALGTVELTANSSDSGIERLLSEQAVLAITDRPVTKGESQRFESAGMENPTSEESQVVLALDGLVIVVAPGNPVNAISEADIARVFAGQVTNWNELGGPNAAINIYAPAPDSSISGNFEQQVMQPNQARMTRNATVMDSDDEVSKAVAVDPQGIGFVNFSGQTAGKPLSILGRCGLQTPANAFTLKTEEYPFTRRLFVYRGSDDVPTLAGNFIDYLDSQDAQKVIADQGFVDQSVSVIDSADQGIRYASAMLPTDADTSLIELGNMVKELLPAQRVSLTFRFLTGSTNLEARALEDLDRLADLLAAGEVFANKELLLVGFTDSAGTRDANRFLSQQRAERVREILSSVALPGSLDTTPIRTLGFGEASPLTCNDTAGGRATNRRVEVWVRDIIKN